MEQWSEQSSAENLKLNEVEAAAVGMVATHMWEYNTKSPDERIGDRENWDTVYLCTLSELGIRSDRRAELLEIARASAQTIEQLEQLYAE